MTFQKHRFSLSKTYIFELGAPPEHHKNESESDVETKLDLGVFLEHFGRSKGLLLRSLFETLSGSFSNHLFDRFLIDLEGLPGGAHGPLKIDQKNNREINQKNNSKMSPK